MIQGIDKYGVFDLGLGLIISLNPDAYEDEYKFIIPNVFVVQNRIGRVFAPSDEIPFATWEVQWNLSKSFSEKLVKDLNEGLLTEEQAIKLINNHNKGE